LDRGFKVVNALVIDHRWSWGLEIPLRFPFGIVGRFRRLRGEKQTGGWQWRTCLMPGASLESNANRSQPTRRSAPRCQRRLRMTRFSAVGQLRPQDPDVPSSLHTSDTSFILITPLLSSPRIVCFRPACTIKLPRSAAGVASSTILPRLYDYQPGPLPRRFLSFSPRYL
jgi:hypothetical protein